MNAPALWTSQLDRFLYTHQVTKKVFQWTFPCDTLVNRKDIPGVPDSSKGVLKDWACVVNTQSSIERGEHWLLVFGKKIHPTTLYVFDSYGMDFVGENYDNKWFKQFAKHFSQIRQNNCQYQGIDTNVCGHYCIYAAIMDGTGLEIGNDDDLKPDGHFNDNDEYIGHAVTCCLDMNNILDNQPVTGQCCCAYTNCRML